MKMYLADKETGSFIEEVFSIEEGLELIKENEEDDRKYGVFEENFYDIVDENHNSLI